MKIDIPRILKIIKVSLTVFMLLLFVWLAGFGYFGWRSTAMQPHNPQESAGAIVVLTGGEGRIDAGLDLFAARRGLYLYITSVHPEINESSLRARWHGQTPLPICCINLDYSADSTVGNALATRDWIIQILEASGQNIDTIRLVTSDYHMMRALQDFKFIVPGVTILPHPVASASTVGRGEKFLKILLTEYHKFLFRSIAGNVMNLVSSNTPP